MTGALIILLVTVGVGLLLFATDLRYRRRQRASNPEEISQEGGEEKNDSHGEICCGRHLVCDKALTPLPDEPIIYYDDEELDRFAGKADDEFADSEVEEVREVMMTLLPQDVAGWVRSMQQRGIAIPRALRDELFILLEC